MGDKRTERTRAALGEALIALAAEKSFGEITIAEITERAEVGYATFFRHFRDKEALLADVAEAMIDELLALMVPALRDDDTLAASVALCQYVDDRRQICRALLAGGAEANIRHLSLERAHAFNEIDESISASGQPVSLILGHAVGSTLGLLAGWLDSAEKLQPEEMGQIIDRLAISPVRAVLKPRRDPAVAP